jgi:hypothetical protein
VDVYDPNGAIVGSNDNWRDTQEAALEASNLAPTDDAEAALLMQLPMGAYTALLRGNNDTDGIGLVLVSATGGCDIEGEPAINSLASNTIEKTPRIRVG